MTKLSAARVRELLRYDPATGIFVRKVALCNRVKAGRRVGLGTFDTAEAAHMAYRSAKIQFQEGYIP